jgi:hypothetical protein
MIYSPAKAITPFSLNIDPATSTIAPGTTGAVFTGEITDPQTIPLTLESLSYNLISGPTGADLTSAAIFDTYLVPDPINSPGYTGDLFSLDIDPSAPTGVYTANLDIQYVYQTQNNPPPSVVFDANQNFTFDVENPQTNNPTPEPSSLLIFAIGLAGIGLLGFKVRKSRTAVN